MFRGLIKLFNKQKPTDVIVFVKDGYVESVISMHQLNVKVIDMDHVLKPSDNKVIEDFYKQPNYNFYPQPKPKRSKC